MNAIADLVDILISWGRWGGVLLLTIAAALFGLAAWDYAHTGGFFVALPGAGVAFVLVGGFLVVMGNPADRSYGASVGRPPPTPELLAELADTPRPFWVCTGCRMVSGPGSCLRCGSTADVLEVASDDDLKMVLLAME